MRREAERQLLGGQAYRNSFKGYQAAVKSRHTMEEGCCSEKVLRTKTAGTKKGR